MRSFNVRPIQIREIFSILSIGLLIYIIDYLPYEILDLESSLIGLAVRYSKGFVLVIGIIFTFYFINKNNYLKLEKLVLPNSLYLFSVILISIIIVFFVMIVSKYYSFRYYADMANNLEILWRERVGKGLTSPMFEGAHSGLHWFSAHFAPIAYIIVYPFFYIFPHAETIITLEVLTICLGAIPIALYAKNQLESNLGYLIGCVYLLYPTIQYTLLYDFGFLQFSIGFISWAIYFCYKRNYICYIIMVVLALMCREEVGLTLFLYGLYLIVKENKKIIGLITALPSLLYSLTAFFIIIPSFRNEGKFLKLGWYEQYGSGFEEIAMTILTNPLLVLDDLTSIIKITNLIMFFLPLCFLPLLSPSILIITSINFGYMFLSSSVSTYSYFLYYLSPSIPFLFVATIASLKKIQIKFQINKLILTLFIAAIATNITFSPSPISASFWSSDYKLGNFYTTNFHRSIYPIDEHDEIVHSAIKLIPDNAIVFASMPILPLLYKNNEIYIFSGNYDRSYGKKKILADYIIVDRKHPIKTGYKHLTDEDLMNFCNRKDFKKIFDRDGVFVCKLNKDV